MINTYVTQFVEKYGTRNGLILSELCQKTIESQNKAEGFSRFDCEKLLPFMSFKQIRSGIDALLAFGCLEYVRSEPAFDRTAKFKVSSKTVNSYTKILLKKE